MVHLWLHFYLANTKPEIEISKTHMEGPVIRKQLYDGVNPALDSPLFKEERSVSARTQRKLFLDRIDAQTGPILERCR